MNQQEHAATQAERLAVYWAEYRIRACELRGVPLAVYDFIAHNLGGDAARAALSAVPVPPPRP